MHNLKIVWLWQLISIVVLEMKIDYTPEGKSHATLANIIKNGSFVDAWHHKDTNDHGYTYFD